MEEPFLPGQFKFQGCVCFSLTWPVAVPIFVPTFGFGGINPVRICSRYHSIRIRTLGTGYYVFSGASHRALAGPSLRTLSQNVPSCPSVLCHSSASSVFRPRECPLIHYPPWSTATTATFSLRLRDPTFHCRPVESVMLYCDSFPLCSIPF
ncbi:hypothetical protein CPB84DRAFT_283097 [Gymnopilus junonius]|uniref:Uncharacterized protein n=1 Tax=Gymnopilus junonius TaxID=109634 RepID=A0A9P5NFA9_GYMJU|nr:hypothetical protein CPB84DRAFT_283097 [Gymnopilus junonius]